MLNLTLGGVPEHFNYPWYLTLKNKEYHRYNINLRWKDFPGGTGDMCKALRTGEVDIAITLTEGIIKDITEGNPAKILQTYVKTPLIWGIHVNANSQYSSISDLKDKRIAISRFGSGSHLMAIVNAHNQGWDINSLDFHVVHNLEGGIRSIQKDETDYFLWEYFTTKPYVDNGIFKRIDNCPTPWPCFVIAVRNEIVEKYPDQLRNILNVINRQNSTFKSIENIESILSSRYEQKLEDIEKWLSITEWNHENPISSKFILEIQNKLIEFNVIKEQKDPRIFIGKV